MSDELFAKRLAEIEDRLDEIITRYPGAWLIVNRGGMGYDVNPLDSGQRGQFYELKDAEFVTNAPDDIRWLMIKLASARNDIHELHKVLMRIRDLNKHGIIGIDIEVDKILQPR